MPPIPPAAPRRILIVDDNRAIHDDFRKILLPSAPVASAAILTATEAALFEEEPAVNATAPAYELDSAFQGADAIALVRAALAAGRPYSLAFVDVRRPRGMDGIRTTAQLWQNDPDLQVVICTAYSDYS